MTEQVLELAQALGGVDQDEEALRTLCAAACQALDRRLKDGLTAEDCRGAYSLAAAWLAMDWLRGGGGMDGITALSAGDISVRRDGSGGSGRLAERALAVMAPFLRDEDFAFRGVRG